MLSVFVRINQQFFWGYVILSFWGSIWSSNSIIKNTDITNYTQYTFLSVHLYILSCPCKYAVLLADELVDSNAQFSIVSWIWMVLITQGVHCVEAAAFALSLKLFLKACIHWIDASNANFLSITNFCFVYSLENFIFAINESLKLEKVQTPKAILV